MTVVAYILRTGGRWFVLPFTALGPIPGLLLIGTLAGALVILVFRYSADQNRLRDAKNQILAALLGVVLFRHDTALMFREEWRLIVGSFSYIKGTLKPLAIIIIPMMTILAQMSLFYGYQPLRPGDRTIVVAHAAGGQARSVATACLHAPADIEIETLPLWIPELGEVCWRIRAIRSGIHNLTIHVGAEMYSKSVIVEEHPGKFCVSPSRVKGGFIATLFESNEPLLPAHSPIKRMDVGYQETTLQLGSLRVHWLVGFLVVAMFVGLTLKSYWGVEF